MDAWFVHRFEVEAIELGARVLAAGLAMDHAHVLVSYPASVPFAAVVQRLKGATARIFNLCAGPSTLRWQDGYWAKSFDPSDFRDLLRYVAKQRAHHAQHPGLEEWELAGRRLEARTE